MKKLMILLSAIFATTLLDARTPREEDMPRVQAPTISTVDTAVGPNRPMRARRFAGKLKQFRGLPQGSYRRTCKDCKLDAKSHVLTCSCFDSYGNPKKASLVIQDIANMNGKLRYQSH